jgi:hypothetical protein
MKTSNGIFSFLTALTLASASCVLAQNPPPNDDFANRTVLTGSSITFTGTLVGATSEPAETNIPPLYFSTWPFGRSVWWTWTADESTTVVIAIQPDGWANTTNAWLEVYGGTNLNALTILWDGAAGAGAAFTKPPCGYARFHATAGTSYQIRVASYTNAYVGGPFTLQLTATDPPIFIVQPQNCTVSPYGSAFFGAVASGPPGAFMYPNTTYQWFFNGVPIPGEIYPSLLVNGVTTNQAGHYSVFASNVGGITQGGSAILTVVDTNPVPRLMPLRPTNSSLLSFSLTGEPGRWYKIESSTNLQSWINPIWLQLTNPATVVSIQRLQLNHFVRASLDAPTDVCIARLKMYWRAVHILAMEHPMDPSQYTYGFNNLYPYVPKNSLGLLGCPEGGSYNSGGLVKNPPTCTLEFQGRGHVITDP